MPRHLNGVKYPLSQRDLLDVVERVEEKFERHIFVPAAAPVVVTVVPSAVVVAVSVHEDSCRCDACVLAYLNAMEKRIEGFAVQMDQTFPKKDEQVVEVEEINYVG